MLIYRYGLFFMLSIPYVHAALSATTTNYIIGHAPKLNEHSESQVKTNFDLMQVKYSDGTIYNDTNIAQLDIDPTQTISSFLSHIDVAFRSLSEDEWGDIDDDGNGYLDFYSTEGYSTKAISIIDANGNRLIKNSFCDNIKRYPLPYSIQLEGLVELRTQYGVPNISYYAEKYEGEGFGELAYSSARKKYTLNISSERCP